MRPLRAEIDLAALRHNLRELSKRAEPASVIAVVKANAYGHGVEHVLPALSEAPQLAVACIEEAVTLRKLGAAQPVVLLEGIFAADEIALCAREDFIPVIHDLRQLEWLRMQSMYPLKAWLKVDSGMHRLGFQPTDMKESIVAAKQLAHIEWLGIVSHFACADEIDHSHALMQLRRLDDLVLPEGWMRCLANSAALLQLDDVCADWVRPGLALYGMSPIADTTAADFGLHPVMRLRTEVLAVRLLQAGESAGYGQGFVAPSHGQLATIALGYGDGFSRTIPSGKVMVRIDDKSYPLVGCIAMDMALVWLGDDRVSPGDEVVLWGDGHAVELVAEAAQTIPYTLTTMLTARVHREVVNG
ncbi:alanine racemase [Cardiobacteriaceae bacterium TAE3-ERU3]|nr:alanine racemase [Cardiobacteriaceae bacterium TAE3-ERU3]